MNASDTKHLKLYEITNRSSGQISYQPASNADDACKQAGWIIGDCYVFEQKPGRKPGPDQGTRLLVKIPCLTCPFQYTECKKPDTQVCPTQPTAPELQEWIKQAAQSHLCRFVGMDLTKKDYMLGQKWLPIEEAIRELAPKL